MKKHILALLSIFMIPMTIAIPPRIPAYFAMLPADLKRILVTKLAEAKTLDQAALDLSHLMRTNRAYRDIFYDTKFQDALLGYLALRFGAKDKVWTALQLRTKWAADWLLRNMFTGPYWQKGPDQFDEDEIVRWFVPAASENKRGAKALVNFVLTYFPELINKRNSHDFTALMAASQAGITDIVQRLLAQPGIDVNEVNPRHNDTALTYAVTEGHLPIVQLLVQAGANINAKNRYGSVLDLAQKLESGPKRNAILLFLVAHGAKRSVELE